MKFLKKLEKQFEHTGSLVCVGIDPMIDSIPKRFLKRADPFFEFGKWIIDETHTQVIAYKPNSAFYEAHGDRGILSLKKTCDYLEKKYPNIPIILDAKRGDIGHTNAQYAKFIFEYMKADAVTLQPYLGSEALSEFLKYKEKGLIILCKTSNPGAGEFQDLLVNGIPLWQKIAARVVNFWNKKTKADLLLVIGATYPEELKKVRKMAPKTTFLIPGIGKQGGDLEKTLKYGLDSNGRGIIINSSRGIIYSNDPKEALKKLCVSISDLIKKTL